MKKEEILDKLCDLLNEIFNKQQSEPFQYVVGYFRQDNDELVGYHASTFCQITKDILQGKRYSGEDPTEQLKIIWNNISNVFNKYPRNKSEFFGETQNMVREQFKELELKDIYIDVIYLEEGTPQQNFKYQVL